MKHFSISQSAVASLKILSMEMVALAIELAASFSSLSRSWLKSASDTSSWFRYADVLSNSFEVTKGIAHGGTDVLFPHDAFLTPEKSVSASMGIAEKYLDTPTILRSGGSRSCVYFGTRRSDPLRRLHCQNRGGRVKKERFRWKWCTSSRRVNSEMP
jgi:hypothetical protein